MSVENGRLGSDKSGAYMNLLTSSEGWRFWERVLWDDMFQVAYENAFIKNECGRRESANFRMVKLERQKKNWKQATLKLCPFLRKGILYFRERSVFCLKKKVEMDRLFG